MREIRDYLIDIKNECEYLLNRIENLAYEEFIRNEDLKKAFVRSLEVIGEASKRLTKEIRKRYPQIPWKSLVEMRNIIIHEYFGVNYETVWDTIKNRIPDLYKIIKEIIKEYNCDG